MVTRINDTVITILYEAALRAAGIFKLADLSHQQFIEFYIALAKSCIIITLSFVDFA